jgi:hypothetical protein
MDLLVRIERDFTYHAPKPGQQERYTQLRAAAKERCRFFSCRYGRSGALLIVEVTPASREQSIALTELETAVMEVAR